MSRSRKRRSKSGGLGRGGNRGRGGRKGNASPSPAGFWGSPTTLPPARNDVRIPPAPAAPGRSRGPPPLPAHVGAAEHYFAAVYARAVTIAGALAAVGGMIEPEELQDRDAG
ncbi:MAG: hypothetical protein WD080_08855 [Egibacteraceae bacterium]